jgi:sulfur-oxidizing protein SoxB
MGRAGLRRLPIFERNGTAIGVIGQAFPYMPIANPGWMFPE